MVNLMKSTFNISDPLFRKLEQYCKAKNVTMRKVLESALTMFLAETAQTKKKFKLKKNTFRGKGLKPGIEEGDWSKIRDLIYESKDFEK